MKICHIFTLTADIENPFYGSEEIHQAIFFQKFYENPTLSGEIWFNFWVCWLLALKLNQLPPVRSDFHETWGCYLHLIELLTFCSCIQIHSFSLAKSGIYLMLSVITFKGSKAGGKVTEMEWENARPKGDQVRRTSPETSFWHEHQCHLSMSELLSFKGF